MFLSSFGQVNAEEEEEYTVTEYVPPVREEKRKPDNQVKPETDSEGMTAYDPNFYRKRHEERKQRLAEAAGEEQPQVIFIRWHFRAKYLTKMSHCSRQSISGERL